MSVDAVTQARGSTVTSLFAAAAQRYPERPAVSDFSGGTHRQLSYGHLADQVARAATALSGAGVRSGDRVALLSENRWEYLCLVLACGRLGASVACQNFRLAKPELEHCIALVEPRLICVSERFAGLLPETPGVPRWCLHRDFPARVSQAPPMALDVWGDPEQALLILYTSGTTGLPKGAVLSHRAEIARNLVVRAEFGVTETDTFAAWPPLYHMGAAECSLGTLMCGGKVIVLDGFDSERLAEIVGTERLGWLLLMPGMVPRLADELERRSVTPAGVKLCGVMADLVPPHEIARITGLLQAPYANTFGATETGCPPCSSNRIPIGVAPSRLSKQPSPFCEIRLVDAEDNPVPKGTPGELCIRGPTLFSGYFRAHEVNAHEFRGGWFHMGDVFIEHPDGSLDFVDRVKYLIKSGGENIYPAEIERVLQADPRVVEAAVVRRADERWGEVPVAYLAVSEPVAVEELQSVCRKRLAGYKQPKAFFFISPEEFPRSASGKVQRHELEKRPITPRR